MGKLGSLSSKLCTSLSIFTLKDANGAPAGMGTCDCFGLEVNLRGTCVLG
ncbi:hypothetical protein NC653_041340 [Populus alba x Populus x berolinensis]|uniref:Uncharacterized protein n=1 Tax=Populus alba x Populus x berolinensis TaxID=444605 RepID=A0AAD6PQM0_9ROSI|nr:hypothetical protein NC653_041340 [Populus alba x Populus x berolinensis]